MGLVFTFLFYMLVFSEGYERLAQARGNGTADIESCDMFGDDEDAPDASSGLPSGSTPGTQLNPDSTITASKFRNVSTAYRGLCS